MSEQIATEVRQLPAVLSETEVAVASQALAKTFQEIRAEEAEQKSAKDAMKERMSRLIAKQHRLASLVTSRTETRDVACVVLADFDAGHVNIIRADTGEVVESRPLTDMERQMRLHEQTRAMIEDATATPGATPEQEKAGERNEAGKAGSTGAPPLKCATCGGAIRTPRPQFFRERRPVCSADCALSKEPMLPREPHEIADDLDDERRGDQEGTH